MFLSRGKHFYLRIDGTKNKIHYRKSDMKCKPGNPKKWDGELY